MSDQEIWHPDQASAEQVMRLLEDAQNPSIQNKQKELYDQLESFSGVDEFSKYLTYFVVNLDPSQYSYRFLACIILKNTIKLRWTTLPEDIKDYIRTNIIRCLSDSNIRIREIVGSTISMILSMSNISSWEGLFETIFHFIQSGDENAVHGAFSCIEKICDDNPSQLYDHPISETLIPILIEHLSNQFDFIRFYSLRSLLHILPWKHEALMKNITSFLQAIFNLAQYDSTQNIRKEICQCFAQLVQADFVEIQENIHDIVRYMLTMTQYEDEAISLAASDFWKVISESDISEYALAPFVEQVIPILFNGMRLSEEEQINFEYEDQTFDQQSYKKKSKADRWSMRDDKADEDDTSEWTKRKACASGIDSMAKVFPDKMIEIVLPLAETKIQSEDWVDRESAVLLVGAISVGCKDKIYPYIDNILPYIFTYANDPVAHMRCTATWALSRYAYYIIMKCQNPKFIDVYVELTLGIIKNDPSPSSKESALTALSIFIDISGFHILSFTTEILETIMSVYPTLSYKNIIMCHDCLETLVSSVGDELGRNEYLNIYLEPIMKRWHSSSDDDIILGNLMITLSSLVAYIGYNLHDLCELFYTRIYRIMHDYIVKKDEYLKDPIKNDEPDNHNVSAAIDLLCGMCEGMNQSVMPYILNSPELPFMVTKLSEEKSMNLMKSLFGLVGDLAKFAFHIFSPEYINIILHHLVTQIVPRVHTTSVPNNAVWALGEILMKQHQYIEPYLHDVLKRLLVIIRDPSLDENFYQITAITLGRLGLFFANQMGKFEKEDIELLEQALDDIEDGPERESALKGFVEILRVTRG